MSLPALNRDPLIAAFYNYSRIPIWILSDDGMFTDCYIRDQNPNMAELLQETIHRIWEQNKGRNNHTVQLTNELYLLFRCQPHGYTENVTAVIGPLLFSPCYTLFEMRQLSFAGGLSAEALLELVSYLHVLSFPRAGDGLLFLEQLLFVEPGSFHRRHFSEILREIRQSRNWDDPDPHTSLHLTFRDEQAILQCVKDGDLNRLTAAYHTFADYQFRNVSTNPFRQTLYGIISNITMVSHAAIMGGMQDEAAFQLANQYIQKLERCQIPADLMRINEEMAVDFTARINAIKNLHIQQYSPPIRDCIHYIVLHPREDLSLALLAEKTGLTPKYLSSRFRKETKRTLTSFIQEYKIREAMEMLQHSQSSLSEISETLNFSSQSYFNTVFKKQTGMTPRQFRNLHDADSISVSEIFPA